MTTVPGFSAEASVYSSHAHYTTHLMGGASQTSASSNQNRVVAAVACGVCSLLGCGCEVYSCGLFGLGRCTRCVNCPEEFDSGGVFVR